jgi:hypothetical protein
MQGDNTAYAEPLYALLKEQGEPFTASMEFLRRWGAVKPRSPQRVRRRRRA